MYLVECRDQDGRLVNLTNGTPFPTALPAPALDAAFSSDTAAHEFVTNVPPETWTDRIVQADGSTYRLRKETVRIARVTLLMATVGEPL